MLLVSGIRSGSDKAGDFVGKIKINKWNLDGFEQIRRRDDVQNLVNRHAKAIAARANSLSVEGRYQWSGRQRKSRYGAIVYPDDGHAAYDNLKRNTLIKALRGPGDAS